MREDINVYRPFLLSLLFSLILHSCLLALTATIRVSPNSHPTLIKVTLLKKPAPITQKPVPPSVGQPGGPPDQIGQGKLKKGKKETLHPASSPSKPRAKSQPQVKKQMPKKEPMPQEPTQQIAVAPPPGGDRSSKGTEGSGSGGNGEESGQGKGRGGGKAEHTFARPDYGVNPKPPYPLLARRMGAEGVVVLRVLVRDDGSVAKVVVAKSSGFVMLDEAAAKTVRAGWRFIPARLNGKPVESWVDVPIRFVLG